MANLLPDISRAPHIIDRADALNLNIRLLYEAVIDLSAQGLVTANCINLAAGILLNDLGLPSYFFENITKDSLKQILSSITASIAVQEDRVVLVGRVAHMDFDLEQGSEVQRVRIATRDTRDAMEKIIETMISGHRREYYFSEENEYYTYIIRPETVSDFTRNEFKESPFLFNLAGDYTATPEPTRMRYENFLKDCKASASPLVEAFNLPATGETRFMFNSDFAPPQIPIFRQLLKDHGLTLMRAYWEPYWDGTDVPTSICSLYIRGEISRAREADLINDIQDFLAFNVGPSAKLVQSLYVQGQLSFKEMIFAGNAIEFTSLFIFSENESETDREFLSRLGSTACEETFAARIHKADRAEFDVRTIAAAATAQPDLVKALYELFAHRFDPALSALRAATNPAEDLGAFNRLCRTRLPHDPAKRQIIKFMAKLTVNCLKTNFYTPGKRAYSFRMTPGILNPLVFNRPVQGIFFVSGHYASGTHMAASDIARGGLRLVSVPLAGHKKIRENAALLNFAIGPRDRRLKHKDICEDGAAGVVIPHPLYGQNPEEAVLDFAEGILDLIIPGDSVVDYYGRPEMLFFGPDRGTTDLMDSVALRAKERGYPHWRTFATGKACGIPHDIYGLLDNGTLFSLLKPEEDQSGRQTDLQINGKSILTTDDIAGIHKKIGGKIQTCGMGTTALMAAFRALIHHRKKKEKELNLMVIGGPGGRFGGNELLCCKGNICLAIDNEGLLFDPAGLDRAELEKIALAGRTGGISGTLAFPVDQLSPEGFKVAAAAGPLSLPDGTVVEDGAAFHRDFLLDPAMEAYIRSAGIRVCIPCGGYREGITRKTIALFLDNFKALEFIVEGAGLFFDDGARRHIAGRTHIYHLKDSTANKGGVYASSMAEVLPAFLLGDEYETAILDTPKVRCALIREILDHAAVNATAETEILIRRHKSDPSIPLFAQSDIAGEEILALQALFKTKLNAILKQKTLTWKILEAYIPKTLSKLLGKKRITAILNSDPMQDYRDAIITKKMAAIAFYRFGTEWEAFTKRLDKDFSATVTDLAGLGKSR
ncbi:MAG: NAD-glutamate dehydrogenase [Desulfobacterales bacterium]|nr:NAD-glutamate dehydrogenase [Desulfobacterales bacterium]